jgi:hypothetical protein
MAGPTAQRASSACVIANQSGTGPAQRNQIIMGTPEFPARLSVQPSMNATVPLLLLGVAVLPLTAADLPTYPTKPGVYETNGWKYEYAIHLKGSRSESRTGRLFFNGREITASHGAVTNTPLGRFRFHQWAYERGWLNTLTRDYPVFDEAGSGPRDAWRQTGQRK